MSTFTSKPPQFPRREEPIRPQRYGKNAEGGEYENNRQYRQFQKYAGDQSKWIMDELGRRTPDDETRHEVLLAAPGGKIYSLQVTDSGTITVILVQNP